MNKVYRLHTVYIIHCSNREIIARDYLLQFTKGFINITAEETLLTTDDFAIVRLEPPSQYPSRRSPLIPPLHHKQPSPSRPDDVNQDSVSRLDDLESKVIHLQEALMELQRRFAQRDADDICRGVGKGGMEDAGLEKLALLCEFASQHWVDGKMVEGIMEEGTLEEGKLVRIEQFEAEAVIPERKKVGSIARSVKGKNYRKKKSCDAPGGLAKKKPKKTENSKNKETDMKKVQEEVKPEISMTGDITISHPRRNAS